MALQPIDLQALFSQMDKVGKSQIAQKEGQQIQAAMQQVQFQKKTEENVQSVNEAQKAGEEAGTIKDEKGQRSYDNQGNAGGKKEGEEAAPADDERPGLIRDPALGRNIDISG